MKLRFDTYDIICSVAELQKYIGMRVNNIYDIDNKTYLIRLQRSEEKVVLMMESGTRFHTTSFEWQKHMTPSGFSMKLRKHLNNKRLEALRQLGCDRIVDLQFGTGEAAYHVIIEMFDRGNIMLTDHEWTILYVLRPHVEGDRYKFAVREKYPLDRVREVTPLKLEDVTQFIADAKDGDTLKKVLMPKLEFGPALLEHVLLTYGFTANTKIGKQFSREDDIGKLFEALQFGERLMSDAAAGKETKGYIIQKKSEVPDLQKLDQVQVVHTNDQFYPRLFKQHEKLPYAEYETYNQAVDEYFSTLQSIKADTEALQKRKEAIKKLENVRKDHNERLNALEKTQELDKVKADLIIKNQKLVDDAILAVQSAVASQLSWMDIDTLVKEAGANGDPIAKYITQLKLDMNHITLQLSDPYPDESDDETPTSMSIDVDLALTAFANARRYYDKKRSAASKQKKTIESQSKALKSAERKTKQVLKEVQTTATINKARKVYWFEKFFWFISSENYLVIAGRDQQQNELIVKRYMKPNDIYVHADIHGASSVVIKNPSGKPVPPKTLNEAGTMAICYSVAWDAKVLTNAYWVYGEQVSKSAPTGEYLTTGSFMIRGKKNFLPPSQLVLGLGFLFRLEDGSIERHKDERKVIAVGEEEMVDEKKIEEIDEEVVLSEDDNDDSGEEDKKADDKLEPITEENADNKGDINIKEESSESESEEDQQEEDNDENNSAFPDTQVKIKVTDGEKVTIQTEPSSISIKPEQSDGRQRTRSRNESEASVRSSKSNKSTNSKSSNQNKESNKQQPMKRGQKSKLKKIKEKYKDQDEEERLLRMEILQSTNSNKKNKKGKDTSNPANIGGKNNQKATRTPRQNQPKPSVDEEVVVNADVDMLDALTGLPTVEDEILFAVPVVAPYNTLAQYKFKVKLTPGTSKRGKAAKTAVSMFLHDKTTSNREKDLLKAVKDDMLARNIPGKVKLSAPKLLAAKAKK